MKTGKRLLLLALLAAPVIATAQVFPIDVSIHLSPPYSPYLTDYTALGSQRLVVQVFANDQSLRQYPCKLRMTIEGPGITLRTQASFHPQPLHISAGDVQTYVGEDLAEYFHPDAMDVTGRSAVDFRKGMRLPEGIYRFGIEVVDYYRGAVVSNRAVTTAWIILNDPPLLNAPANGSVVQVQDPANVLFSWTPRHTASPNAALTTQYNFRLVEVWPRDRNPHDALLTQHPLYETDVDANQLLYGPTEPSLMPGRTYAWQVTARDIERRDLFKNQGRSEVYVFTFGQAMVPPERVFLRWAKPTTLAIRWTAVDFPDAVRYRLQYRPRKTQGEHPWHEHWTRFTDKTLYHLKPSTEYEVRLRTENDLQESAYGPIQVYKTLPPEAVTFVCRDVSPLPRPDDSLPVFPLSVNDTLHAGGYKVLVRDVMQVGSRYYGSGLAIVPYFNEARVRVTFENIRVNAAFRLTSGVVRTQWEANSKFLIREEKSLHPAGGPVAQAGDLDVSVVAADSLVTVQDAAVVSVDVKEDGVVVVVTSGGERKELEAARSYAITDDVGNGYVVDRQGNVAKTSAHAARASAERGDRKYELDFRFTKGDGQYGIDTYTHPALSSHYEQLADGTYLDWKALADSRPDRIEGEYTGPGDLDKLHFQLGGANVSPIVTTDRTATLSLTGKAHGWEEELIALHIENDTVPPVVVGKVNTATYHPKEFRLVIVSVNDVALPGNMTSAAVANYLNDVYEQAVVSWRVDIASPLRVDHGASLDVAEAGLFSNYTSGMKAVLNAFGSFSPNVFYLFVVDQASDAELLGYMPRGKQAGFVFVAPHHGNTVDFLKTIAHELGHGAFQLKHPFQEYGIPTGTTPNLMDYNDGAVLYKYQWDLIHEPGKVIGLFEDSEQGEMVARWWERLPPYWKAAEILQKHLESTGTYESVVINCDDSRCIITAELKIEEITYTMDVTFPSGMTADELLTVLMHEYRVDLWEALNVRADDMWDELYHWWRKQNDDLAQQSGWQVDALTLLADVMAAPTLYPAVKGWVTGKHWRDGRELENWEQALAVLDFLVAEEIVKGCITRLVVRLGGNTADLLRLERGAKSILQKTIQKGFGISVVGNDEIAILSPTGKIVGKVVNDVLVIRYPGFGGDIVCHPTRTTTVIGKFHDLVDGEGISFIKENKLYEYGENIGGINILDATDWNQPMNNDWLREAVARGDVIRVISDPRDVRNLYTMDNGEFLNELKEVILASDVLTQGVLSPFGNEIKLLEEVLEKKFNQKLFIYE